MVFVALLAGFVASTANAAEIDAVGVPAKAQVIAGVDRAQTTANRAALVGGVAKPGRPFVNIDPVMNWEVLESDETLRGTLERWGRVAHWEVKWQGAPEVRYLGYANFPNRDFLHAADFVLSKARAAAKSAGVDLNVSIQPNRVLVVSTDVTAQ